MIKLVSNTLEMSTYKRRLHVLHGFLEYALILTVTLIAIIASSTLLVDQITNLLSHAGPPITISTLLQ